MTRDETVARRLRRGAAILPAAVPSTLLGVVALAHDGDDHGGSPVAHLGAWQVGVVVAAALAALAGRTLIARRRPAEDAREVEKDRTDGPD